MPAEQKSCPIKNKPLIALKALLLGIPVVMQGDRWTVADNGQTGILAYNETSKEEIVMLCDLPISVFVKMAEAITDAEIIQTIFSLGMLKEDQKGNLK